MIVKEKVSTEKDVYIAPCLKCGHDDVSIFDYGYNAPNLGGGKCKKCGHEVVSACNILPTVSELAKKWNSENDIPTLIEKKELEKSLIEDEINQLKQRL